MSNLRNFLIDNNAKTDFASVKNLMDGLKVNVRYHGSLMRFYAHDDADKTNPVVQECTGTILDSSNDWQIVCWGMNFFLDDESVIERGSGTVMTEAIDGTLIRCWHNADGWQVSTTKSIDAGKAYWGSSKSFKTLFLEAVPANFFDLLSVDRCYSFVLQHPAARNVTPVTQMRVYHVATRNMVSFVEEATGTLDGVLVPPVLMDVPKDVPWHFQGVVLQDPDFRRCKVKNPTWEAVAELKGNYPNIARRYLEIRKDASQVKQFLNYFPEYTTAFDLLDKMLSSLPEDLFRAFDYYFIKQSAKMTREDLFYYGCMGLFVRFKKSKAAHEADNSVPIEPTTLEVARDYVSNLSDAELAKVLAFN